MLIKTSKILIFGLQYPEPKSTAAGSRMLQLISLFQYFGWEIHFVCVQAQTDFSTDLNQFDVIEHSVRLNNSSAKILLQKLQPEIIMFDRFITEEQFGWMADETCPNALKILDTEDLHFLRENRENFLRKPSKSLNEFSLTDKAKREIGAIYRCDFTLMISTAEINILKQHFNIPDELLFYLPFVYNTSSFKRLESPPFAERKHMMSIGNFKHAPNLDMVKYLHQHIWTKIRCKLPQAEWHIYGAYLPQQVKEWHKPEQGIIVKGRADEVISTLRQYKVMLAPLRFGAGLKGKCLDSMIAGTPSVTTNVGAEGIADANYWPGFVKDNTDGISQAAIKLYQRQTLWENKHEQGIKILMANFDINIFRPAFKSKIDHALANLKAIRGKNVTGMLLKHHHQRSTKFMSLWIEEKNKNSTNN